MILRHSDATGSATDVIVEGAAEVKKKRPRRTSWPASEILFQTGMATKGQSFRNLVLFSRLRGE